jgi:hypothetical protein
MTILFDFPQIKIKSKDLVDLDRVKRLKCDLRLLKNDILSYAPSDFNYNKLKRLRFRVFKFSRKERCNEFFTIDWNRKYVCLNSCILNRRYHSALLHTLHGIAHSYCHLKDEIAEEAFCEYVSYSILKEFLKDKRRFRRRVIRGIMKKSPKNYNKYYRAARKLEKKKEGIMLRMNNQSRYRKISRKKQKKLFYKLTKVSRIEDYDSEDVPELERGFRKF